MASWISSKSQPVSSSQPNASETFTDEKNAQSAVTCVYQTQIGGYRRNVTVLWSKNLMNYSFSITVDSVESDHHQTCKVDLKPWHFWAKKGYKSFEIDGNHVEAFWDLRSAKFAGGPEPSTDFYVALVYDEEVVLLLGDYKKKAYKRTKSRPALVDGVLFYRKEHVFGKKSFATRGKFDQRKKDHEIVVECSTSGLKEPEMWVSVDGAVVMHVKNLQWKFRGNQIVVVDRQPVQVFWDVQAWLFGDPGSSYGWFIFKPGGEGDGHGEDSDGGNGGASEDGDGGDYSAVCNPKPSPFCLFLYAWKIE